MDIFQLNSVEHQAVCVFCPWQQPPHPWNPDAQHPPDLVHSISLEDIQWDHFVFGRLDEDSHLYYHVHCAAMLDHDILDCTPILQHLSFEIHVLYIPRNPTQVLKA